MPRGIGRRGGSGGLLLVCGKAPLDPPAPGGPSHLAGPCRHLGSHQRPPGRPCRRAHTPVPLAGQDSFLWMEPFVFGVPKSQRLKWELTCDHVTWTLCTVDGLEAINSGPKCRVLSKPHTPPLLRGRVNLFSPRKDPTRRVPLGSPFPGGGDRARPDPSPGDTLLDPLWATSRAPGGTASHSGSWGPQRDDLVVEACGGEAGHTGLAASAALTWRSCAFSGDAPSLSVTGSSARPLVHLSCPPGLRETCSYQHPRHTGGEAEARGAEAPAGTHGKRERRDLNSGPLTPALSATASAICFSGALGSVRTGPSLGTGTAVSG